MRWSGCVGDAAGSGTGSSGDVDDAGTRASQMHDQCSLALCTGGISRQASYILLVSISYLFCAFTCLQCFDTAGLESG